MFEVAKDLLAPGFAVSDAELERAVAFAAQKLKLLVEPGGAAALAALLAGRVDAKGKTVALVLSGGNAEFAQIAKMVERLQNSPEAAHSRCPGRQAHLVLHQKLTMECGASRAERIG